MPKGSCSTSTLATSLAQLNDVERDAHGHVRIAEVNIGEILKSEVQKRLRAFDLKTASPPKTSATSSCADPIPMDMEYTRDLGYCAAKYLMTGGNAAMISMQAGHFVPIPFKEMIDSQTGRTRLRLVDINSATCTRLQGRYMIRLPP